MRPFSFHSATKPSPKPSIKGSVFFAIFAAVGMVGIVGATGMQTIRGPVKVMSEVTKRTVAENAMMATGRMALVMSSRQVGDCDGDGLIEPIEWADAGEMPAPANGGHVPPTIGASLTDPWGTPYGYCVWDHGARIRHADCGAGAKRLRGDVLPNQLILAVISAGPDKKFDTGCQNQGEGQYILKVPGSDDMVLSYSYAEAVALMGDLWVLKEDDPETATIAKNLSVTDAGGDEQFSFDAASRALSLGSGGTGELPNIKTDFIQNLSENVPVEFLSPIRAGATTISVEEVHAVAVSVTSGGDGGVGLKVAGTSKAIESEGILDMTGHRIINLAEPEQEGDAVTKKYIDEKIPPGKKVKCEAFVFSGCSGGTTTELDTSSLGDCKKSCEEAGVRCCHARFATTANNPHVALSKCTGHTNGGASGTLANLLLGLLFPANAGAYCYEQY